MLRSSFAALCLICMGIGILGVIGSAIPVLSIAEDNLGLHLLYRLRGAEKPKADVVVVAIDRESAKFLNLPAAPNKWPRKLHARLLDFLINQHAAVVAFDLIFHEPQQTADDEAFAAAIRRAGNVVLTQPIDRETMPLLDHNNMPFGHVNIEKMVSAIPIIANAAMGQAPFPLPKVPIKLNQYWRFSPGAGDMPTLPVVVMHLYAMDAFKQFLSLLGKVDSRVAATLPVVADSRSGSFQVIETIRTLFRHFEKETTLADRMLNELENDSSNAISSENAKLMKAFIGLYGSGSSSYLNFYGPPRTVETIAYHKLLSPDDSDSSARRFDLPSLQGKVVFVGQTESDWFKANDGFHTAFTQESGMDISGVEIAATAFANLVEEKVVHPFDTLSQNSILLGWGIVASLIVLHFSALTSAVGLVLLNGLYLGLAHVQFKLNGIWFPLMVPMLVQTPAAYIAGLAWKYRIANMERRNIRKAFGYYLPDDVVKTMASSVKPLRGGGQVLYSICLFTDAERYTTLSEQMDPESLTRLMNSYYESIFKPIKDHGGLVLQVVGDSVLAMWTAPQAQKDLKVSACKAAIGISKAVQDFNATAGRHALPTRVGMHAGEVLLGNIGAIDHYEYRPVGDIVNTASRLEGLNKYLGTRVLASQEVWSEDNDYVARPVGKFVFKGKSQNVRVNQLVSSNDETKEVGAVIHQTFSSGLRAFDQQKWDEAEAFFFQALKMDKAHGPSEFYRRLCLRYREAPPAGNWDGTVHLKQK